jgi:transposase
MTKKIPLTITVKEICMLNNFSVSTARREIKQIKEEAKEAGKRQPRKITINMYAEWSGIDADEIRNFFLK